MTMFSLSTAWNFKRHKNGRDLVDEIKRIGFDTIELNFGLTEDIVDDILSLSNDSLIKVSSLHNMCPLPPEILPANASPDHYSLASLDEKERAIAVRIAKNTISYAHKFGARAIVLHAGRVPVEDKIRGLERLINDEKRFNAFRLEMMNERAARGKQYLERAMKSLSELIPYARDMNVCVGVENRYHYREIPIEDEFEVIFKNFPPGQLYYWHDVGHAEAFERLGLCSHKRLLDKFSHRLIGIHLHDIIGALGDHKAPGFGSFEFSMLKPYITGDIIKVLEVHEPATADDIQKGAAYLNKVLG